MRLQEVGVIFLLTGNGVEHGERQVACERFRDGEAARLCDDEVGRVHKALYFRCELDKLCLFRRSSEFRFQRAYRVFLLLLGRHGLFVIIGMKGIAMKQIFKSREKLWVSLIIIAFAVLLVTPQLFTRKSHFRFRFHLSL